MERSEVPDPEAAYTVEGSEIPDPEAGCTMEGSEIADPMPAYIQWRDLKFLNYYRKDKRCQQARKKFNHKLFKKVSGGVFPAAISVKNCCLIS